MTALAGPAHAAGSRRARRIHAELAVTTVVTVVVVAYLGQGPPATGQRLLVGNLTLAAAMLYGFVRCLLAAGRTTAAPTSWTLMSVALDFATLGQLVFASALLQGSEPAPSPITD